MKWKDSQIKDARRIVDNGGVAVNPVWLSNRAATLEKVRNTLAEINCMPRTIAIHDVRRALVTSLDHMLSEVQQCLEDTANTPPVRDVLSPLNVSFTESDALAAIATKLNEPFAHLAPLRTFVNGQETVWWAIWSWKQNEIRAPMLTCVVYTGANGESVHLSGPTPSAALARAFEVLGLPHA